MKDLTIEITNCCSLNCLHCSTDAKPDGKIFVPVSEIGKILNEFPDFNNVRLSGGEPFMHPDFKSIADICKMAGKNVGVLSSGVYYGKEIPLDLIRDSRKWIDKILISIYGGKETHNRICNAEAYSPLIKSVDNFVSEKIPFSFQTVAMKGNQGDLREIFEYIARVSSFSNYCKPELHVLRFIKQGRGSRQDLALSRQELDNFRKEGDSLSEGSGVDVSYGCSFLEQGCTAGQGKAVASIYRERTTCSALKYHSKQGRFACRERW